MEAVSLHVYSPVFQIIYSLCLQKVLIPIQPAVSPLQSLTMLDRETGAGCIQPAFALARLYCLMTWMSRGWNHLG